MDLIRVTKGIINKEYTEQYIENNNSGNQAARDINVTKIIKYDGQNSKEILELFIEFYDKIRRDTACNSLSHEDVIKIFNNLFEQKLNVILNETREIVDHRCKELILKFFTSLYSQNPSGFSQVIDPDFQYDLFIAQRDYARYGDPILSDMLVRLLIERTKETQRSRLQIALNESITIVSKLTKEELDALTALFVVEYHSKSCKFDNIPGFASYISAYVLPFWDSIKNEGSVSAQLFYTGCCEHMLPGMVDLEEFLSRSYSYSSTESFSKLKNSMENDNPKIKPFFAHFDMSILNHMFLTSVGIAIGYANLCNNIDEEFDLSKWL